jgi:hypothetical protein
MNRESKILSSRTPEDDIRAKLCSGEAILLDVAPPEITNEWTMGECHDNVATWCVRNRSHRAVLGWVITANCTAVLHSVVDTGEGMLDITPRHPSDALRGLWFVRETRARSELLNILSVVEDWPVPAQA